LFTGKRILTYSASPAADSVKVRGGGNTRRAVQHRARRHQGFKDGQIGKLDDIPDITAGAWQMRPLSRGYVEALSPNPAQAPAINRRYLSDPTDRRAIIGGPHFIRRLFAAPAVGRYCGAEILPGAQVESNDELLDYAAEGLDRLSQRSDGSGRRPAARARARRVACDRRFSDADRDLDQHQRPDHHDR
jgi:choline dehydrogenase